MTIPSVFPTGQNSHANLAPRLIAHRAETYRIQLAQSTKHSNRSVPTFASLVFAASHPPFRLGAPFVPFFSSPLFASSLGFSFADYRVVVAKGAMGVRLYRFGLSKRTTNPQVILQR
jgi:hypothetical protein